MPPVPAYSLCLRKAKVPPRHYRTRVEEMSITIGGYTASGSLVTTVIFFVIGWIISTIIIYVITTLMGEKEGIGTAVLAALVGAIIYSIAYFFLGQGLWAGLIGGFFWLIALGSLYEIGWLRALLTAIIVWIVAIIVGYVLPTIVGPL